MEQPLRIPSCEVLGAGQRTQTLTCPVLAQQPKISGWSLPHSGSTTRGLLEGPAPFLLDNSLNSNAIGILEGLPSSWDAQSNPRGQQKKNLRGPHYCAACLTQLRGLGPLSTQGSALQEACWSRLRTCESVRGRDRGQGWMGQGCASLLQG